MVEYRKGKKSMCTSLKLKYKDIYVFGRNLDLEYHFNEGVIAIKETYLMKYKFLKEETVNKKIMGIGSLIDNYPLFAEAMNEDGLCIAGLNYPGNAYYHEVIEENKINLAPYELINYLLINAKTVDEVKKLSQNIHLVAKSFKEGLPLSYLHYLISDKDKSIVLEPDKDGIKIYDNPYEVLTNNPSFNFHLENIKQYGNLSNKYHLNNLTKKDELKPFCIGLNAHGLPGDSSSPSRFVKTVYLKEKMEENLSEKDNLINEAFHIFECVSVTKGAALTSEGRSEITVYTSVLDPINFVYYYKTYESMCVKEIKYSDVDFKDVNFAYFAI